MTESEDKLGVLKILPNSVIDRLTLLCSSRFGFHPTAVLALLSGVGEVDRRKLTKGVTFNELSKIRTQYDKYGLLFEETVEALQQLAVHSSPFIRAFVVGLINRHNKRFDQLN